MRDGGNAGSGNHRSSSACETGIDLSDATDTSVTHNTEGERTDEPFARASIWRTLASALERNIAMAAAVKLNWGLLGAAAIAKAFVRGLGQSETGRAFAVASRGEAKAQQFAKDFDLPRFHGSYEALLADPDVDAIYVALPHPMHAEWAIKALRAGKHVLCEKPFTVNLAQAMAVAEAARAAGRFVMEAFMYRCHPQTRRLVELIRDEKVIGEVRTITACFSFQSTFDATSRLFDPALAGGGILDVGCYPMSLARLIAGAAVGKPFADPIEVKGVAKLGPTGVDHWAAATLGFEGGIVAQISCGVEVNQDNACYVFGSTGRLVVPNPFVANRSNVDEGRIDIFRNGETQPRHDVVEAGATSFAYEADAFAVGVATGEPPHPTMNLADTLGNLRALDAWRTSCGLTYPFEKSDGFSKTAIDGAPLAVRPQPTAMTYAAIAHVERPVSRLILGCDNQNALPHAAAMFDDFFERGGNTFDTAFVYGPLRERLLGQWIALRGVRDQVNVIVKGAHSPMCFPDAIGAQLRESLERLQIGRADVYMLHRDNAEVPVGEFVEALNEHVRAGRIAAFGGSNWSIDRVQAANDYATAKGVQGFSVVSNQFSLARPTQMPWPGCVGANDPASRAWFERTQTPLLAWSSQAHGFFVPGRADPAKLDNGLLSTCFYSDENFHRLARATELAERLGVNPTNVALAFVLSQPFPTFALVGPRTLEETRTTMPALGVALSDDDRRWLDLEA